MGRGRRGAQLEAARVLAVALPPRLRLRRAVRRLGQHPAASVPGKQLGRAAAEGTGAPGKNRQNLAHAPAPPIALPADPQSDDILTLQQALKKATGFKDPKAPSDPKDVGKAEKAKRESPTPRAPAVNL